jgi:hypothetical protein
MVRLVKQNLQTPESQMTAAASNAIIAEVVFIGFVVFMAWMAVDAIIQRRRR